MISFPNCKINLGLNIIRKRADGYHDLETVFYPVKLRDVLEVVPMDVRQERIENRLQSTVYSPQLTVSFSTTGLNINGDQNNNLCIKAYHLLQKDFQSLPPIKMHLHKTIPMGAGLGGGSADGAFTLKLLNDKFNLNLSTDQLVHYALQLGSDCPFFIINQPCFANSRGEVLEKISLDLSAYKFIIVNPGIHISTVWAFAQIIPQQPAISIKDIIHPPLNKWKGLLKNDFEAALMKVYPSIQQIKEQLYNAGAVYVSMTGSGSTLFGIFEKDHTVKTNLPSEYFTQIL